MRAKNVLAPGSVIPEDVGLLIRQVYAETSTNFRRMGTAVRKMNRVEMFLNARIQGIRLFAETFAKHPVRTMARGTVWMTGPTLGLWYHNRDKDWYQNLPAWRRLGFWNINLGSDKDPWILSIPIPFEFGLAFKAYPEAVANTLYMYNKDSFRKNEDIEGFFREAARQFVPINVELGDIPTIGWSLASNVSALAPGLDIVANKRWPGRPLVPERLRRLSPEMQKAAFTSATAKYIGQFLGMSPIQVDHLIRGYSGGALSDFITMVEAVAGHPLKDEALIEGADSWLYGRFLPRDLGMHGDIQWMWDEFGTLDTLNNDWNVRRREKDEGWREYRPPPQMFRELAILREAAKKFKARYKTYEGRTSLELVKSDRARLKAIASRARKRIESGRKR
jgi:hypothetical protein